MPPEVTRHPPPILEQARRRLAVQLERCLPELRGVLASLLVRRQGKTNDDQINDLLSELTQELLARADVYDPSRSLVAWASGFAMHILANRARREQRGPRQVAVSQLGDPEMEHLLETLIATTSHPEQGALRDWLDQLSAAERQVIECRYLQNLTGNELAEAIGAPSAGAARVRLSRGLKRLREIVRREKGGEA